MNTLTQATAPQVIEISQLERAAAARYILAIIARDPNSALNTAAAETQSRRLWERFMADYQAVSTGPYARRGDAALRTALGRL